MNAVPGRKNASLRPMLESDVEAVMAIERRAYPAPWTEGIFRDCLRVGYSCWVMLREGRVVGYSVLSAGAREAHLLNLCIAPEAQGEGLGRQLIRHMLERAASVADTVFLEVRPSNAHAIALYTSMGFVEVGRRKAYYPDPGGREDAIVMALGLG